MEISFYGAAKLVTGSCYLLTTDNVKILVDCGMFQGNQAIRDLNFADFPFIPKNIDYLLLTHAHIDHSGRIPKLTKEGFTGKIITSHATKDLCSIMLEDSAHIQEVELEWQNRKRIRKGLPSIEPLYTSEDIPGCMALFQPIEYNQMFQLNEFISLRMKNSGHMLGSALIELWVKEEGLTKKIVFTGDLGNINQPLLENPDVIREADYLVIESTYGNRFHELTSRGEDKLLNIITETAKKGGNIIIPSFAIGRTQEMLYQLNQYKEGDALGKFNSIAVYVDSPLAIKATDIFKQHYQLYDNEAKELLKSGDDPLTFNDLHFTLTTEQSKSINLDENSKIIISASGMCDAGRIRHHLKHNLWRKDSSIVFVGFQAEGTLGQSILNGAKQVNLFGDEIQINASIYSLDNYSGHADLNGLLNWVENFTKVPEKIILIHGETQAIENFEESLVGRYETKVIVPNLGDTLDLLSDDEFKYNTKIQLERQNSVDLHASLTQLLKKTDNIKLKSDVIDKIQYNLREISNIIDTAKQ